MSELNQYYQQLEKCDIQSAALIKTKLNSCQRRSSQGKPNDKSIQTIEQMIERASLSVTRKKFSVGQIKLADLPVAECADEISAAITENQVVVIAGETGSGKTTQLPKICLQLGLGVRGLIGHTQPRRLAARTVAQRISEELNSPLGEKVGYQVRFTEQVSELSLIKLMTDGILLAETQHDPLLLKYQVIIIDEAHERSLNIDFLLGYLRRILPKRPDLKVIITSATIDLQRFSEHFDQAPVIEVSGRTYPVEMLYRPLMSEGSGEREELNQVDGIVAAVEEIIQLHKKMPVQAPRDILVFLSGEREIRETAEALRKAQLRHTNIMPLYSRLSVSEQNKIFQPDKSSAMRVILATNVAETSVTVPGIGYVIDAGLARISRYSYRSKVQRLPIEAISQASANQRAGRCGRIAPGVCIRLYSEEDYSLRPEFTDAEIRRTNLAAVILQMLNLKLGDIAQFPFIDPPDQRFINDGFSLLQELSAVDQSKEMTPLGRQMAKLPVDPRIARMVIEGGKRGALSEVLVIASALSVQDPKERPLDKQQAADQCHKEHQDPDSDFVGFLNLWRTYEEQRQALSSGQLRKYALKNFLSFMRMREWRDVHRQLHLACKSLNYSENKNEASYEALHISLLSGLLSHIGFKQENKEFLGARSRKFYIFPASTQYKKPNQWVMASELVETSKLFGRNVAKIEPQWVEQLAGHLLKKSHHEARWQKRRAQVVADEQIMLYGLVIVAKRQVHFGPIDPVLSQEIFIRSALVQGEYDTKAAFFEHNRRLLDEVEALEVKTRRRDLLVDEETLYQFYADKINTHSATPIINGASFEKWRKNIEQQQPELLLLKEADILQRSADHIAERDYPNALQWKGVDLSLEYNFEPQAKDDGVSINLPVALVKQFPAERLQWLVPGLLRQRCIALLKALPKARRKHFVPIPNFVDGFLEYASFAQGELLEQLTHYLLRRTSVKVSTDEFDLVSIERHLQFNVKLLDADGKVVDQGRDIQALSERNNELAEASLMDEAKQIWGETGLSRWSFDQLPASIETKQGGILLTAWPMLKVNADKVDLVLSTDKYMAERENARGITHLALLELATLVKTARSSIKKINESTLYAGKIFTKKDLESEIISFAMRQALSLQDGLPRSRVEFEQRLTKVKSSGEFVSNVAAISQQIFCLHQSYHQLQRVFKQSQQLQSITVISDMQQQLQQLIHKGYMDYISWSVFQRYTIYMKGLEKRLEKYQRELPRQRMLAEQLQAMQQQLNSKVDLCLKQGRWHSDLDSFRWLMEEYRLSLFAQPIKTLEPVSEKRMQQKWRALDV